MSYYDNIKLINIIYIECIRKLCLIILVFNAFTDNIVTPKFLKNVKKRLKITFDNRKSR